MICFSRHLSFTVSKVIADPAGQYLLETGDLEGAKLTLVTYYAPNTGQLLFFEYLLKKLAPEFKSMVTLECDSNLTLDLMAPRSIPPLNLAPN